MKLENLIFDKNFYEDEEYCVCCGYEFEALDNFFNLINVVSGGQIFICEKCIKLIKADIEDYEFQKNI